MRQVMLGDPRIEGEIGPVLKAMKPGVLLSSFLVSWVLLGTIVGVASIWGSERPWSESEPSLRWVLVVVLGSGITASGSTILRVWALRRYLTRTNTEIRDQLAKDWSTLTAAGWPLRLVRFSIAASLVFGGVMGTLFSVLFPEELLLGSTLGTIGAMTAMFLVPIVPMTFGFRALLVRQILRPVGPEGVLPSEIP